MGQRFVCRFVAVAMFALVVACPAMAWAAELAPASLTGMVVQAVDAQKTDDGNWFFKENADGATATLVAYVGASKAPTPPATAGGLPVTGIVAKPSTGAPAMTGIDLSKVKGTLESLQVYGCKLASLDALACSRLTYLDVRENALAALAVPPSLETLMCSGNELSALDVSRCAALGKLYCDRNMLYALDVSKCSRLYYLNCADNRLTSLKCGSNLSLNDLFCAGNYLSEDLKALTDRYGTDAGVVLPQNSGALPLLSQVVSVSAVTVEMGKTVSLGARASAGGALSYKSSDERVAKVSSAGVVTPVAAGSATIAVTAAASGLYDKATATAKVTVMPGSQALAFKAQTKKVSAAKVKKKARSLAISKATGAKTKVTYSLSAKGKAKKRFSINKSTGKMRVKKGTPKGKYVVTVKASAAKSASWKAASKSAKITVKVA